jgi:hypothetical protein
MKEIISNIMKFTAHNGSVIEYINMNEFADIQYYPDKNMITFQQLVGDQSHVQIRQDVDKDSICLL